MVRTPPNPMSIPMIIHFVTFVQRDSQIVKMVINKGTNAAMIAANPLLIYSSDQVSKPLATHNSNMPCKEIFFSASHPGIEYPRAKKKLTKINPEENCLTPETKRPGMC